MRLLLSLVLVFAATLAWADGPGARETLALETCLADNSNTPHLCYDIPYYVCMGEQMAVAANPELAQERCLFQELFVWDKILEDGCTDLGEIFEPGTSQWEAICFDNNSPNWIYLTDVIAQPEWDNGFSQHSLRLAVISVRSTAVQITTFIAAYRANGPVLENAQ